MTTFNDVLRDFMGGIAPEHAPLMTGVFLAGADLFRMLVEQDPIRYAEFCRQLDDEMAKYAATRAMGRPS